MPVPDKLRIPSEEYDYGGFTRIGRLADGTQFMAFVTGAFPNGRKHRLQEDWPMQNRWIAVIHRFDAGGNHIGSESRAGAFDDDAEEDEAALEHQVEGVFAKLIGEAEPELCDVWVKPFTVRLDGLTHGLIYEDYLEEDGGDSSVGEYVILQPHEIMFHPPWDSGDYST
jgi:hypothetical protein